MNKRKRSLDLVTDFLNKELQKLQEEIKLEKGNSLEKIELKVQISDAINLLNFCSDNDLFPSDFDLVKMPEQGSDSFFTEYLVVDETEINNISPSAIVKNKEKEVKLSWSDIILKRK